MKTLTVKVAPFTAVVDRYAIVLRVVGLTVLVVAGALAIFSVDPPRADLQALLHDVRGGRVHAVELRDEHSPEATVRWSTGVFQWWSAPIDPSTLVEHAKTFAPESQRTIDVRATIEQEALASGHPVSVRARSGHDLWAADLPWPVLSWAAAGVWLIAFVVMLLNNRNRYANRWAWLWLFLIGTVGPLLYLALEPRALWRREREHPERRLSGGVGLLYAWLLTFGVGLGVLALRQLLGANERSSSGELIVPVLTRS